MTDETKDVVSEEGATSTEQSQSEGAQEAAKEEAPAEEAKEEEPAKEDASATEPAGAEAAQAGVGGLTQKWEPTPTLIERVEKIEADHKALVKKLDDQYAIR